MAVNLLVLRSLAPLSLGLLLAQQFVFAAGLANLEKSVTDFQLANGLRVVVAERSSVPVASVLVHVKAGSAQDPPGKAGLARLFERLISHGSREIGTQDWAREKPAIAQAEASWRKVEAARRRTPPIDPADLQTMEVFAKMAQENALAAALPGFVHRVWDANGIQGRFDSSVDATTYLFTMPSNRVEVCLKIVGAFLREPVFRNLRQELVNERERAARSSLKPDPAIRSLALLARAAFAGGPYSRFGGPPDPDEIQSEDVDLFFKTWFKPNNIVVAITGPVLAADVRRMVDLHLSNLGASPPSAAPKPASSTPPPPATSETRVVEAATASTLVTVGFRRPEGTHPDDAALLVAYSLLAVDADSMIGQELSARNLASAIQGFPAFPGTARPGLLAISAIPAQAGQESDTESAILEVVERLREAPLPEETILAARTKLKVARLRAMEPAGGLATELARAHAEEGSWKRAIEKIDALDRVTAADVHRVARQYLGKEGRIAVVLSAPNRNNP